ncbi:MAG TPA: BamA/TamA family outer membrane protein, partial [Candidatus Competibacteraceae bacterium]|nr:BamA/TamA family outer membrane protein [Candidatus Competibacteraceae bacterium]
MHFVFYLLFLLFLLLLGLAACTSMVPREDLPYPLTNEQFGDTVKVVTVPLPAIGASPNEGVSGGALTAFLLHNSKDEVSTLLAPQVNYNRNFGVTSSVYGAFHPSTERSWETNLSQSTQVNYDYECKLRDTTFLNKRLKLKAFFFAFADGSARFYGFQSNSPQQDTNYTNRQIGFNLSAGYEFIDHLQLLFGDRFQNVSIDKGAVAGIPFTGQVFTSTEVPGLGGFTTHAQRLALVYSTLDDPDMPTRGFFAKTLAEGSAKWLGSSAGYGHYAAEVKGYFPLMDTRFISVARFAYDQTPGREVPFLERSILGGENTLRGYGRDRFIDSHYFLWNLEERIRLFRWAVFNVNTDW